MKRLCKTIGRCIMLVMLVAATFVSIAAPANAAPTAVTAPVTIAPPTVNHMRQALPVPELNELYLSTKSNVPAVRVAHGWSGHGHQDWVARGHYSDFSVYSVLLPRDCEMWTPRTHYKRGNVTRWVNPGFGYFAMWTKVTCYGAGGGGGGSW